MYRPADIKIGLFGLWGWRQNWDNSEFQLSAELIASSSGQYFQEVHPLLTLDNIKAIAPDFDTDEQFNAWLTQKTQASILKAIRIFWDEKMVQETAKNILESKALFNSTGRLEDAIPNTSKLVGFEITPIRANGVTTKIEKIGLQFKGTGDVVVYLMHSSRSEVIKTLTLARTRDGGMEWFKPLEDLYLPYISADNDAGGSWYLVYDQDALTPTLEAIKTSRDWSARPCSARNGGESIGRRAWSRYLEVHPFSVGEYESNIELWDISKNLYDYETNYGINLQVSVECDATDLIVDQARAFQSIIGLQVAADFLREFAYNPEFKISRTQVNLSKSEILYELDGDTRGYRKSGIMHDLRKALEAVKLDATSLSRVCFPKNNGGIKYKSI